MTRRTAFVTGATGFVGLNLVALLVAEGWRVIAFHRPDSSDRFLGRFPVEHALGDVTDAPSILRGLPRGIDAVFHVAGSSNMWARRNAQQTAVNVDGTRHVVAAALAQGARKLVFCSSWVAYGAHTDRFDETAPQLGGGSWVNHFRTKYLSEQEVRAGVARGLDASIINPALILGPYDTKGWARFILLIEAGRLPGVPPGRVNFTDVREVAKAHLAAAERGRAGQNYLLGGPDTSFVELVREICAVTGRKVAARPAPGWVLMAMAQAQRLTSRVTGREPTITPEIAYSVSRRMSCDYSLAERELGYHASDLRTMVEASWRWLRDEGMLTPESLTRRRLQLAL